MPLASDALLLLRQSLSDLDNTASGRWQDATLLNWLDRSNKRLVGEVLFPDSRIYFSTVAGQQLYEMPLMLKTERVYVAGQLAVPTDQPTLNAEQIWGWDQSSDGSTSAGPGGDAAPGTVGPNAPLWATQEPLSYPVNPNDSETYIGYGSIQGGWCTPAPDAQPWYLGSRPRYYWRGGWLGLVPPPSNSDPTVTVCGDGIRQPDTITTTGQQLSTPDNFLEAIVWGACVWCFFSNDGNRAAQQAQIAEANYTREKRRLIAWRWGYEGTKRDGPKPAVLRNRYAGMRVRRVSSGWR